MREEVAGNRNKLATCEERFSQARGACEAWQREAEEANRKATIAEQQRDEVSCKLCTVTFLLCLTLSYLRTHVLRFLNKF